MNSDLSADEAADILLRVCGDLQGKLNRGDPILESEWLDPLMAVHEFLCEEAAGEPLPDIH